MNAPQAATAAPQSQGPERIPLSVPNLDGKEGEYLAECVDTGWVSTAGPFVGRFEKMLRELSGGAHVVATSSGTAALHLAAIVAGVEPNDEVIVPAITFMATCGALRYVGAYPTIVDIDERHWQLDPDAVARFLAEKCERRGGALVNRETGRTIKAIGPAHILGHPCDLDRLVEIGRQYGLPIIEDAAEALGATYKGRPVGAVGLVGGLSFNGNKIVTTGGGGAVLTRDRKVFERAMYLSTQAKDDPVRYVHKAVGFNYRMTNISAALGCAQLERLDAFIAKKKAVANQYKALLGDTPGIRFMEEANWAGSTWWLFTIRIAPAEFGCDREAVMAQLAERGIETRPLWEPMHRSEALAGCYSFDIKIADQLHAEALSLPCSTNIREADVERVAFGIVDIHRRARR
jgi:perosamine synthetase